MRSLVTGGAGFIGSHLAEALYNRKDEVWVIDDLSTGRRKNIAHLEKTERFHFIEGTVLDSSLVSKTVKKVDRVFHLAASVGVKYVMQNPLKSIINNIRGTEVVLEEASRKGCKVILFSTSEVYGKGNGYKFREDDDRVLGPTGVSRWSYATSKAVDEFLAFGYWRQRGLPVVIVRCFNTCGPRQTSTYGMVVPTFVEQALNGEPILVYGDGTQTRCFSYVGDVIRGVLELAESEDAVGEVFNIGTDEEVTISELADRVKKVTGSQSMVKYVPYEDVYHGEFEDMMRRVPDLSKIRETIGFSPRVNLTELLRIVVEDVKSELESSSKTVLTG
jgi:UDP-glucose 4-epimerase